MTIIEIVCVGLVAVLIVMTVAAYKLTSVIISTLIENNDGLAKILASKDYHHFVVSRSEEKRVRPERSIQPPSEVPFSEFNNAMNDPHSVIGDDMPLMNLPPNPPRP